MLQECYIDVTERFDGGLLAFLHFMCIFRGWGMRYNRVRFVKEAIAGHEKDADAVQERVREVGQGHRGGYAGVRVGA